MVRWTAPTESAFNIEAQFTGVDDDLAPHFDQTTTDVDIRLNGITLFSDSILEFEDTAVAMLNLSLVQGDFVDFIVGYGFDNSFGADSTQLSASISTVPIPIALPLFSTAIVALGLIGWRRTRQASST